MPRDNRCMYEARHHVMGQMSGNMKDSKIKLEHNFIYNFLEFLFRNKSTHNIVFFWFKLYNYFN